MGLIYKPNGEKYIPDRKPFLPEIWDKKIADMLKPTKLEEFFKIQELRQSCGVKSRSEDTIKIRSYKQFK